MWAMYIRLTTWARGKRECKLFCSMWPERIASESFRGLNRSQGWKAGLSSLEACADPLNVPSLVAWGRDASTTIKLRLREAQSSLSMTET